MRAEDILPDDRDIAHLGGVAVRKGSVAAFLANARVLADPAAPAQAREQAERDARELLPALRALGLFEAMEPRDPRVRAWLSAQP